MSCKQRLVPAKWTHSEWGGNTSAKQRRVVIIRAFSLPALGRKDKLTFLAKWLMQTDNGEMKYERCMVPYSFRLCGRDPSWSRMWWTKQGEGTEGCHELRTHY